MSKIEICCPTVNPDSGSYASFSHNDAYVLRALTDVISEQRATPQTHRKVLDLFSGDGSLAVMFNRLGWNPDQITCVDKHRTDQPLLPGCEWCYLDLGLLAMKLRYPEALPLVDLGEETLKMRHQFDIVAGVCGFLGEENEKALVEFFMKADGISFF